MKLNKSTAYALCALLELADAPPAEWVGAGEIAARHDLPETVLAKVLQQLQRAGLVVATRGAGGGYRLARPPAAITVTEVLAVFEPERLFSADGLGSDRVHPVVHARLERLSRLFDEVDELVRCTFASVTLATLIGRGLGTQADDPATAAPARDRAAP